MRVIILATAALAALTIASAPAAAQGNFNTIRDLCPDLSTAQIKDAIPGLAEVYKDDFSADPEEAAKQSANLLCGYGEVAEAPADQPRQASVVQEAVIVPPPHFNGPKPHFNGPKPHFRPLPPRSGYGHRLPPPPRGYARPLPPPPHGYARPLPPPPMAMTRPYGHRPGPAPLVSASRGYSGSYAGAVVREERQPMTHQRVRSDPYCLANRDIAKFEAKYPRPAPHCVIGDIPNMPCPGWVCR